MSKYYPGSDGDVPLNGQFDPAVVVIEERVKAINPGFSLALSPASAILVEGVNKRRRTLLITNTHASEPVYIKWGPTTGHAVGAGAFLAPAGGAIWFGLSTDMPYTGEVSAISLNASTISVQEI